MESVVKHGRFVRRTIEDTLRARTKFVERPSIDNDDEYTGTERLPKIRFDRELAPTLGFVGRADALIRKIDEQFDKDFPEVEFYVSASELALLAEPKETKGNLQLTARKK